MLSMASFMQLAIQKLVGEQLLVRTALDRTMNITRLYCILDACAYLIILNNRKEVCNY